MRNTTAEIAQRNPTSMHQNNEERNEVECMTGFAFKRRRGRIDWRKIDRADLESIVNDIDIDALQEHVEDIAFADITEDDLRYFTDEAFLKLFRLAQLTIEYLLFVQDYLIKQSGTEKDRISSLQDRLTDSNNVISSKDDEIRALRKECRHIRKVAQAYERMIGVSSGQTRMSNETSGPISTAKHYECTFCNSAFISEHHLQAHTSRRHPHQELSCHETVKGPDPHQRRDEAPAQQVLNAEQIEKLIQDKASAVMGEWMKTAQQMLKEAVSAVPPAQHAPPPPPPPVIIQQPAVDTAIERALISQEMSQRMLSLEGKLESVKAMMQVDLAQRSSQQELHRHALVRRPHRSRIGPLEPVDSDTDAAPVYGKSAESDHDLKEDIQSFFRKSIDGFKTGLLDEVRRAVLPVQNTVTVDKGKYAEIHDHKQTYREKDQNLGAFSSATAVNDKKLDGQPTIIRVQQANFEEAKPPSDMVQISKEGRLDEQQFQKKISDVEPTTPSSGLDFESDVIPALQMTVPNEGQKAQIEGLPVSVVFQRTNAHAAESFEEREKPQILFKNNRILVEPIHILSEPRNTEDPPTLFAKPSGTIVEEMLDNLHEEETQIEYLTEMHQDQSSAKKKPSVPDDTAVEYTVDLTEDLSKPTSSNEQPDETDIQRLKRPPYEFQESGSSGPTKSHQVFNEEPYCHVLSRIPHSTQYMAQERQKIEALVDSLNENDYGIMENFIVESGYDRTPTLIRVQALMDEHYKTSGDGTVSSAQTTKAEVVIPVAAIETVSGSNRAQSRTQSPRYEAEPRSQSVADSDFSIEEIDL